MAGKNERPQLAKAPLAYENPAFLNSPDGRGLRILAEYLEPLARFRRERIQDTVVFFGSARWANLKSAEQNLASPQQDGGDSHSSPATPQGAKDVALLEKPGAAQPAREEEQPATLAGALEGRGSELKLKRARAAVEMARYYEDARRLAYLLTKWSMKLPSKRARFVVTSGGGPGIMEAANLGACEAGGKTIGLNIRLPFEQFPNRYITPELNFEFHYFFMRKYWFAYLAKALVIFPGGFGTLDELFELLTLAQTEKLAKKIIVIIYGREYWNRVINLQALVDSGAISPEDIELFSFADSPEEAFECLKEGLTRYHLQPQQRPKEGEKEEKEEEGPEIAHTRR
jgi:uncharacterized protein (TIGR00730 family)